ncbi:DUF6442 family protein [Lacrimispora brassicae]
MYADNKDRRYRVIGFCSVCIIIMLFNFFMGQNNFVLFNMFWAYISAETYGKYRITKLKTLGASIVFPAITSILFLACHVLEVLGIGA